MTWLSSGHGRWLNFLVLSVMLAVGAFWKLIEWWVALWLAPDVGTAFLGMQGDPWDAQWARAPCPFSLRAEVEIVRFAGQCALRTKEWCSCVVL
ncbi:MAG: DUF2238 domain-containing protein [Myxococcaceae bacterium]